MNIIPAIDLLDGQVVRLQKGDYAKKQSIITMHLMKLQNLKQRDFPISTWWT